MRFWPTKRWKQALILIFLFVIIAVPVAFGALAYTNREPAFSAGVSPSTLTVSSVFANGAAIPTQYTAMGENVNPPLNVTGIPESTKSLVVIVYDPIMPGVISWTHWVVWDLPVTSHISENTASGTQGRNSWNRNAYSGPDPMGTRTYYFTVYALDNILNLNLNSGTSDVLRAMDNHVIAKGQLTGTSTK